MVGGTPGFRGTPVGNHWSRLFQICPKFFDTSYRPAILYNDYIETYFSQENFRGNEPKLTFETRHAPSSVSIAPNVPDFVTNGDENKLVQKMMDCLDHASTENIF